MGCVYLRFGVRCAALNEDDDGHALELLHDVSDLGSALKAQKCAVDQLGSHVTRARDCADDTDQPADFARFQVSKLHVGVNSFKGQLENFFFAHIIDHVVRLDGIDKRPQSGKKKVLKHVELPLDLIRQSGIKCLEIGPIDLSSSHYRSRSTSTIAMAQDSINKRNRKGALLDHLKQVFASLSHVEGLLSVVLPSLFLASLLSGFFNGFERL